MTQYPLKFLGTIYKTTWHHIPENRNFCSNCKEKNKFQQKCMWIQKFKNTQTKIMLILAIFFQSNFKTNIMFMYPNIKIQMYYGLHWFIANSWKPYRQLMGPNNDKIWQWQMLQDNLTLHNCKLQLFCLTHSETSTLLMMTTIIDHDGS
jgi:hypothetical protein